MQSNSGNISPVDSDGATFGDLDGTKPITDRDSKMVMLRGERGDEIQAIEIIEGIEDHGPIPDKFKITQRLQTYYGAELQLKPSPPYNNSSYMLTAPGPDKFLYLWTSETDDDGFRKGWSKVAELKVSFSEDIPKYPICNVCGGPIKSLEHERLAAIDQCESLSD